ncbi:MAG TPA: hypothetical protein VFM61_03640 [Pseudidiomarina sp.]|nr:hypothetical protein [Pseudidiomarina sp.]
MKFNAGIQGMLIPLLVVVVGFAALLSGVWEQNWVTISIGVVLMFAGWLVFFIHWRKTAKQGNINNHEQ